MAETVAQTYQRITGKPWSQARADGLTDGSASANLALQKKLNEGYNPYAQQDTPAQAAPQQAASPVDQYQKLVSDWYAQKPVTPGTFNYSPEQEAADKASVQQEYRPFYQEQATNSGNDFQKTLQQVREGFSRRGLWGAAAATAQTTDPSTGLTTTNIGTNAPAGGPVSGLRQQGEQQLSTNQAQNNTAFGRAYTQAVATGAQGRQAEASDVYNKTVTQPYQQQYQDWMTRLQGYQAAAK